MRLRTVKSWRPRDGRQRKVRLYKAWMNMRGRVSGTCTQNPDHWLGIPILFADFEAFRKWSLANGFSRDRNSLDRIDPDGPYSPENCRWISVAENTSWMHYARRSKGTGALLSGAPGPDVPF